MKSTLAEEIKADLARSWYARGSSRLRQIYKKEREIGRRNDARFTMWAASIIYSLFSVLDAYLLPDVAYEATAARIGLAVVSIALIETQVRFQVKAGWIDAACASIVIVACWIWIYVGSTSAYAVHFKYYIVFCVIFMMCSNLLFNFGPALASAVSTTIMLVVSYFSAILAHIPEVYLVTYVVFYISSMALTLYVNWKLNSERYNVFLNALNAELRQDEVIAHGKELLHLSNTDALTGLSNRRAADARLGRLWEQWERTGEAFVTILIDIDFFKNYNDSYGHQAGDQCLVLVSTALAQLARRYRAEVARFGGEEFIIYARMERDDDVVAFAEAIRRAVRDLGLPHEWRPDGESAVTASVGAASSRSASDGDLEELINKADRALYQAKAAGRNCVRVFDERAGYAKDEGQDLVALLRTAIVEGAVSLVYQPIRSVDFGIKAAEALMRLRRSDGSAVPPSLFIPVAERTGAILELGRWAIRTACRELVSTDLIDVVSVNVSAVQLKSPGFAMSVASILGETGVAPHRLALEITEGREVATDPDVLRCIGELKQLGVKIWLDDFGTGFASLSCLRLIDFDAVKIDRSFLHESHHPRGASMLQDIIRLVRNNGHKTIVEGVETEEQLILIGSLGIKYVQGFHIGNPVSPEVFQAQFGLGAVMNAAAPSRYGRSAKSRR